MGGLLSAAFGAAQLFREPAGERIDARYAPAREALQGVPVAGFISDQPLDQSSGAMRFHRAQYGVAPALLRPDTREAVLLVDLADSSRLPLLLRAPDLRLRKDLGGGLAIVEKR